MELLLCRYDRQFVSPQGQRGFSRGVPASPRASVPHSACHGHGLGLRRGSAAFLPESACGFQRLISLNWAFPSRPPLSPFCNPPTVFASHFCFLVSATRGWEGEGNGAEEKLNLGSVFGFSGLLASFPCHSLRQIPRILR